MRLKNWRIIGAVIILAALAAYAAFGLITRGEFEEHEKVNYGISPYQDTILPRVAEKLGWDKEVGLAIDTKMIEWGDVMPAVASGAVDVAIQNFNSFQATYENINKRGGDVIFYYPLFIFKGAAIMVRSDSDLKSLQEMQEIYGEGEKAIIETIQQLEGETIFTTIGTEKEQLVLLALQRAAMKPSDVKIVHAQPDESLYAFLHGDAVAFTGGVTDQLKARKEGHMQMITGADLGLVVIDGLVTTEHYANEHPETLLKLINLWFRTILYVEEDLDERSKIIIEDLNREGSFTFDVEDFKYTWLYTEIYPSSSNEMAELVLAQDAEYYWKNAWDANNEFLLKEDKITEAVPYDAFWMEKVQYNLPSINHP